MAFGLDAYIYISQESKQKTNARTCNCRIPKYCPLNRMCLQSAVVYKGTVTCKNNTTKTYIGSTETTFKERYGNHNKSFNSSKYSHETKISKYAWEAKQKDQDPSITWSIVKKNTPYKPGQNFCDTCTSEALEIIKEKNAKGDDCLNVRSKLSTTCRHRAKFKLKNTKT